jgi:integrase
MAELRQQEGIPARALEFAILTAARSGEAMGARWSELNRTGRVWAIPGERMKTGKEHRIPLSDRALAIIEEMAAIRHNDFVFPGARGNRSLSNVSFYRQLHLMQRPDLTTHGFRSTFRDWAAERTAFPAEVAEMALAHTVSDKVEAAYRRGTMFEKRRQLADAWAKYCGAPPAAGKVVALRTRA